MCSRAKEIHLLSGIPRNRFFFFFSQAGCNSPSVVRLRYGTGIHTYKESHLMYAYCSRRVVSCFSRYLYTYLSFLLLLLLTMLLSVYTVLYLLRYIRLLRESPDHTMIIHTRYIISVVLCARRCVDDRAKRTLAWHPRPTAPRKRSLLIPLAHRQRPTSLQYHRTPCREFNNRVCITTILSVFTI